MTVTIRAGSWLRNFIPETTVLTLAEGAAVSDALALLPKLPEETGLTVINGRAVPAKTILRDGDKIELFPMIVGG